MDGCLAVWMQRDLMLGCCRQSWSYPVAELMYCSIIKTDPKLKVLGSRQRGAGTKVWFHFPSEVQNKSAFQ